MNFEIFADTTAWIAINSIVGVKGTAWVTVAPTLCCRRSTTCWTPRSGITAACSSVQSPIHSVCNINGGRRATANALGTSFTYNYRCPVCMSWKRNNASASASNVLFSTLKTTSSMVKLNRISVSDDRSIRIGPRLKRNMVSYPPDISFEDDRSCAMHFYRPDTRPIWLYVRTLSVLGPGLPSTRPGHSQLWRMSLYIFIYYFINSDNCVMIFTDVGWLTVDPRSLRRIIYKFKCVPF